MRDQAVRRVAVIGCGGAGKSTFARALGARTGLPVIHLDEEHWRPGWVEPPDAEWAARVRALTERPQWIIDGNYRGTMGIRIAAADVVVFLDLPRLVCLAGVLRRNLGNRGRAVQAPGCPEHLDLAFLRWIWRYPRTDRPRVLRLLAEAGPGARVHRLRSRRAVRAFLASSPAGPGGR